MQLDDFTAEVRDAFAHLDDLAYLRSHRLALLLGVGGRPASGEALRRVLLAGVEWLRPPDEAPAHAAVWRRYRYLRLRYLEGTTHEGVAQQLGVSTRQARRDHIEALEALGAALWDTYQTAGALGEGVSQPAAAISVPPVPPGAPEGRYSALDAELSESRLDGAETSSDLENVLASVIAIASRLPLAASIGIQTEFEPDLPAVAISRTVLRQILLGALQFAVSAAGGNPLRVAASTSGAGLLVRVTSASAAEPPSHVNGALTGAPEPAIERSPGSSIDLFDVRLSNEPPERSLDESTEDESTALLEAIRHLAERQSASVECRGPRAGGSAGMVEIRLPVLRPATVLVIDDNPGVGRLFERFLHRTAYRVVAARTWQKALRLAEQARPDVVTLDVMMPSQDGWDVLRALKEHQSTRDIPIIVCSVLPEKMLALALGAAGFLEKPVSRETLLAALGACLRVQR